MEVQFISASWCKKCVELKPEAKQLCSIAGIIMTIIDFDELDEIDETDEPIKNTIKSLPTIRMKISTGGVWTQYTTNEFDIWKSVMLQQKLHLSFDDDNF